MADGVDRHALVVCRTDLGLRGAAGSERRLGIVSICAGLRRHATVGNARVFSENPDRRSLNHISDAEESASNEAGVGSATHTKI